MGNYSAHELPIFWIGLLSFAIVFNAFCSNKFEHNVYCFSNSFSPFSRKGRFHSTSVLYSTSQKEVVRLNLYPSLSFLKSSKMLISNSHSYTRSGSSMMRSDNVFKKSKLVVDLKFAERLRSSQKNDSLPLVNDIIVTEQKQSWVVYVIINSLNALPSYRGITNMNVDLIFGNRTYHNKFKVMKEHQIRLLKYVVSDLPPSGTFTLIDHATSWEYDSLPFRVVPLQPKRRMAICAYLSSYNTVNEIRFFLAFYLIQKVDTVIFYCPDKYDYFSRLLKKEIESGYVILYNYPWPLLNDYRKLQHSLQISQINSCYYRHRSFYEYIISIDMDEYLYSELLPKNLYQAILNSFRVYPPKDDIAVQSFFYTGGANREFSLGNGSLFNDFNKRMDNNLESGRPKQVIHTSSEGWYSIHWCYRCVVAFHIPPSFLRIAHFRAEIPLNDTLTVTHTLEQYTTRIKQLLTILV